MIREIWKRTAFALVACCSMGLARGEAGAEEIVGRVKSVDAAGGKLVVAGAGADADREVSVDSGTSWTKEKKGKASKKFELAKLKVGAEVEVTRDGGPATRIVIKAGKKKKAKAA